MKPISLKIKGLNSFIEAQEVNFEKLTEKGLFGIFGPTGSGKSTILDGITLALYGEVSRNSTNYMNTNCDSMNVSYEFQMTDKDIKRYRVDREFRRDSKTGSVRSKSAKIVDITSKEEVLEDKAKLVTEKCEEIIGLRLEDFTRTVVLPQGKFSEFLKLAGKDRRDMLERLFNLHKYGDGLSNKLKTKIYVEFQKFSELEGELRGYDDISDEILEEKTKSLDDTKEQLKKCQKELDEAEKSFNEGKELWSLQNELKELKDKEKSLREKEDEINENKMKVMKGESALKVKPYIDNYENTQKEIEIVDKEILSLMEKTKAIKDNKKKAEELLSEVKNKKDTELPLLKIKEQKVLDAIEDKKVLNILIDEKKKIEEYILKIEKELENIKFNIELKGKSIININNNINSMEEKAEALKIPEEFKNRVNDGLVILNTCESFKKEIDKIVKDARATKLIIENTLKKSQVVSELLNEKESKFISADLQLKELIDNCPGDQNTLLKLNEKLKNVKDKWNKDKEYNLAIEKSNKIIEKIQEDIKVKKEEKLSLEKDIKLAKEVIKNIETENLAHVLREELSEGEVCPVCGSTEHHKINIKVLDYTNNIEELRQDLKIKEDKFTKLTAEIIKDETNYKTEENNINDNKSKLKDLGDEYKLISVEVLQKEFDTLYAAINNYNSEKNNLEKLVKILSEEKNKLLLNYNEADNTLSHNKEQLVKLQEDFNNKSKEYKETDENLKLLKTELQITDFKITRAEIIKKENERALLEREIKVLRDKLNIEQQQKEKLASKSTELMVELKGKKTVVLEKNKNIEEKHISIRNKAGDVENLEKTKEEISKIINTIEKQFEEAEKHKNQIEELFNDYNSRIISTQGNLVSLKERSIKDKDALNKILEIEGIDNIDEIKNNFISKEEINKINNLIENYKNSLAQLTGIITDVLKKINNRILTDEQWIQIQNIKSEKKEELTLLQELSIKFDGEVKLILVKLEAKKVLLKKKEDLDYKLGLLNDLERLFRGKKFIEFVAANQLKYISIEASKKLKEITGGIYGLEVDENGKFIIRDYKNGGAQRDASTLSGGETFVASLSLALALSSQIQLKGTSPLELFFLDEGFGTLDDNLLDIVMDSLEKIHNDKLSIGIISHVESIKNRVPVKLIVTPAVAGLGGSKVKIERS